LIWLQFEHVQRWSQSGRNSAGKLDCWIGYEAEARAETSWRQQQQAEARQTGGRTQFGAQESGEAGGRLVWLAGKSGVRGRQAHLGAYAPAV